MARVAQYKALGSKLGGYRKTLSDVGAKEYAKKHADWKASEEKGLYSQIGGSVANIIGIASEVSQLKQLKGYGEAAKQLSGIGERDVEYQPLGSFGEAIGLDPKTRKESFFHDTGQALSTRELQNIGYIESLGMKTKYSQSKYAERPEVPITTEEPKDLPMEVLDPLYESQTKTIGTYDPGLELESMEGLPSIMGDETAAVVEPEELEGYGSEAWHLKRRQKEINNPSGNSESNVFEAIKGDEDKPIAGYTKNELLGIARETVPREYGDEIQMVFGMESSYGQDPGAQDNILQIKNEGLLKQAEKMKIDLSNPQDVSNFYVWRTKQDTKDFSKYKVQSGDLATEKTGKTFDIFGALESQGIDKAGARYLTWQQGRKGVADMTTALTTGKIGEKTVENMLNNLSEDQKKSIIAAHGKPPYHDTRLIKSSKVSATKSFIEAWLKIQNEKMGKY